MAFITPGSNTPGLEPPFSWELVTVLDPRVEDRTTQLFLMVKDIRIVDTDRKQTASGLIASKVKKVIVSPLVSTNDPDAILEVLHFTVVDPRFASSVVQVCFTLQEAVAFRQTMTPTEDARAIIASGEKFMRLKCYIPACRATSSKMEKIRDHFLNDHPDIPFETQKVKLYDFGGLEDRKSPINIHLACVS